MNIIERLFRKIYFIIKNMCSISLAAMLLINAIQVISRYVLRQSLIWSQEVSLILLIWFSFLSMANELHHENHMSIELFYNKFPSNIKKFVDLFRNAIIAIFCIMIIKNIFVILSSLSDQKLPISGLSRAFLYVPAMISATLMFFSSIFLFIKSSMNSIKKGDIR